MYQAPAECRTYQSVDDESRELGRVSRVTKLLECLRFDLTNPFAGHAEFLADLFEGMIGCTADTETHAQDALLPRCEIGERFTNNLLQSAGLRCHLRINGVERLDQVPQCRVAIFANWRIERGRLLHYR